MQRLAVVTLILMGGFYYARQIIVSLMGATGGKQEILPDLKVLASQPGYIALRQVDIGITLALAIAGVVISALPERGD